jgi:hypothetical protein
MHAGGVDLVLVYDPDGVGLREGRRFPCRSHLAGFKQESDVARAAVVGQSLDDLALSRGRPERPLPPCEHVRSGYVLA